MTEKRKAKYGVAAVLFAGVVLGASCVLMAATPEAPAGARAFSVTTGELEGQYNRLEIGNAWEPSPNGKRVALPLSIWRGQSSTPRQILCVADIAKKESADSVCINRANWPVWSKNESMLAYAEELDQVVCLNIHEVRIALCLWHKQAIYLPTSDHVDRQPEWSDDAREIAFSRLSFTAANNLPKASTGQVCTARVCDGVFKLPRCVSKLHSAVDVPQWRPGTHQIAYVGMDGTSLATRTSNLYLVDVTCGKTKRLTKTGDVMRYSISWSPDGKYIAFATRQVKSDYRFQTLEVIDVRTDKRSVVLKQSNLGGRKVLSVASIRWSPRGDHILFDASEHEPGNRSDVGMINWPGRKLSWLTHDRKSKAPRWSPDGSKVLYVKNQREIWATDLDGTHQHRIYQVNDSDVSRIVPER